MTKQNKGQPSYHRPAWEDRFNEPTVRALGEALPSDAHRLFERAHHALEALADQGGANLAWHGPCWRWTIEYRFNRGRGTLAVLVPNPVDLQLAAPVNELLLESLPKRRLRRAVRDGLDLASPPFDTNWAIWSVSSVPILDEVLMLLERRLMLESQRSPSKMTG